MQKATGVGKNIEKAIENALEQLGCNQDEVTIKVISEGGLFKKAEVEVTRDEAVEPVKAEEPKLEAKTQVKAEAKPQQKSETKKTDIKVASKKTEPHGGVSHSGVNVQKEIKKEEPKIAGKLESDKPNNQSKTEVKVETKKASESAENIEAIKEFLTKLVLFAQKPNTKIDVANEQDAIYVDMTGDSLANFIGTSGSTLFALETIVNVVAQQNGIKSKRIILDIGGYKKGKVQKLYEIADKAAIKVLETGEQYKMRPMPARERRAIHAYLQDKPGIKTVSKGDEPNRFLIVQKSE